MKTHASDRPFQFFLITVFILIDLLMLAPMIHLLAISMSARVFVIAKQVSLWPRGFSIEVYKRIVTFTYLWRALGVSVFITVVGTLLALVLSSTVAFSISRPTMKGRKIVTLGILFTFIFTAPLIPTYLVVLALGMRNHLASLIVPGALGAFYVMIMKTFFQLTPSELYDAAKIDGCNEFSIYARIVIPLSKAVLATIALFHAVNQWNAYFEALIYIRDKKLYPLQIVLRNFIIEDIAASYSSWTPDFIGMSTPEMMRAGVILFATIPILIVYPFLQKYFVKGATLGSIKG